MILTKASTAGTAVFKMAVSLLFFVESFISSQVDLVYTKDNINLKNGIRGDGKQKPLPGE